MSAPDPVAAERDGALAWLRLQRPERLNAFDRSTYRALRELIEVHAADAGVRAIAITGSGRAFSAGADLKARTEDPAAIDVEETLREYAHPLLRSIRSAPQPVIAAVNGAAVGIGCSLALNCDLVVAVPAAEFSLRFARVGLGPDGAAALRAAARAGGGRAARMLLLGETVPAPLAYEWGLVDHLAGDDGLEQAVAGIVESIDAAAPLGIAAAKRALARGMAVGLEQELALEQSIQGELSRSRDHAEALAAFGAKRRPEFTGS